MANAVASLVAHPVSSFVGFKQETDTKFSSDLRPLHRVSRLRLSICELRDRILQLPFLNYEDPCLTPLFTTHFLSDVEAAVTQGQMRKDEQVFLEGLRARILYIREIGPVSSAPHLLPSSETEALRIYHEVVRRVPNPTSLEKEIESLPDREKTIAFLATVVNSVSFFDFWSKHPLLSKNPRFSLHILSALEKGVITQHQFGTLMTFETARRYVEGMCSSNKLAPSDNPIKCVPIFERGVISVSMKDFLRHSLTILPKKKGEHTDFFLDDRGFERFFHLLTALPESEKTFLLHDDTQRLEKRSIRHVINTVLGLNFFSRVQFDGRRCRMVPSFGMMQAFLRALNPIDPIILNPVLNISSVQDIRLNGLHRRRDCFIPSPFCPSLTSTDGYPAPGVDPIYHDWYHALKTNALSAGHHTLWTDLADCINDLRRERGIGKLWFRFIDGEHPGYPLRRSLEDDGLLGEVFWEALAFSFAATDRALKNSSKPTVSPVGELEAMHRIVQLLICGGVGKSQGIDRSSLFESLQRAFQGQQEIRPPPLEELRRSSFGKPHLKLLCLYVISWQRSLQETEAVQSALKPIVLKVNLQSMQHLA